MESVNEEEEEFEPAGVADDMSTFYLSNSEMQAWKRCRRKWWLGWYRQMTPVISSFVTAMARGTRVHNALATWYVPTRSDNLRLEESLMAVIERQRNELVTQLGDIDFPDEVKLTYLAEFDKDVDTDRAMIEGYTGWLAETGADSNLVIESAETPLTAPVGTTYVQLGSARRRVMIHIIGILDARVRRTVDGARMFIDHKTVGDFTRPRNTLHMNEQMMHYMLMEMLSAREGEPMVGGALYNMIRRVKRTASAKPPFYDRLEITHTRVELASFRKNLMGQAQAIINASLALSDGADPQEVVFPSRRGDCSWDCEFFSLCPLFDDGSHAEAMLAARYRRYNPLDRYHEAPPEVAASLDRLDPADRFNEREK